MLKINGPTIFYHEDDFRQVELVPNNNLVDSEIELKHRQINPNELEQKLLNLGLERVTNVLTGYGQTYRESHKNCIAFYKNYSAIYFDFEENIVQNIWLTNHWCIDRESLANGLYEIGKQWNLLLQDWHLTKTVDLNNKQAIYDYLLTYDDKNDLKPPHLKQPFN